MKSKKFNVFVFLMVIVSVVTLALSPMPAHAAQGGVPTDVLSIILKIAIGFAALAGFSKLNAVIVQVLKYAGIVKDGTSSNWAAGLNLAAFIGLIYFGVFQPHVTVEVLDGYAAQIAEIALYVFGFIMQMTGSKPTYDDLKASKVPVLSYHH